MKTKPPPPPPAFGLGWGIPWLTAVIGSLLLWAGIAPPLWVFIGGAVLFLLVPLFVPKPEKAGGARTWQLASLVLALLAFGGAVALKRDAPLEAVREGVRAALQLTQST